MKGDIPVCLQEMVETNYGKETWINVLKRAGQDEDFYLYGHHDYEDELVVSLFKKSCEVCGIDFNQLSDLFGETWMKSYVTGRYFAFFIGKNNSKDFLMSMGKVHEKVTNKIENARPPKFLYEEIDENTITMEYVSQRNLQPIWLGLVKAVGKHFNEKIEMKKLNESKVELTFSKN